MTGRAHGHLSLFFADSLQDNLPLTRAFPDRWKSVPGLIRLLLYSQDKKLPLLLGPTLGSEFEVTLESDPEKIKELVRNQRCHVVVLDLDSGSDGQQHSFVEDMRSARVPVVVMADDDYREAAMDLVQLGVYDYFRKPPSLAELKIVVR